MNSCVSLSLPIDGVTDCNLDGMYFINIVTGGSDFQFMDYFELVRNTTLSLCLKVSVNTVALLLHDLAFYAYASSFFPGIN